MNHVTKEWYEQVNEYRYQLFHVIAEMETLKEENERLKEGLDTTMSLLAGKTDEEVKMCYDYLYDLRYPNG